MDGLITVLLELHVHVHVVHGLKGTVPNVWHVTGLNVA